MTLRPLPRQSGRVNGMSSALSDAGLIVEKVEFVKVRELRQLNPSDPPMRSGFWTPSAKARSSVSTTLAPAREERDGMSVSPPPTSALKSGSHTAASTSIWMRETTAERRSDSSPRL